jgi:(p)ppGpp synthase/HD superfamily hydrolase
MENYERKLEMLLGDTYYKILDETDILEKAKLLVDSIFAGIKDKSGEPYVNHLYSVSEGCKSNKTKVIGLLHDVIEDTILNYVDLLILGFPKEIALDVQLLTKTPFVDYTEYINKILNSNNRDVLEVKYQDMLNNSSEERLVNLPEKIQKRLRKKYEIINSIKDKIKELEKDD